MKLLQLLCSEAISIFKDATIWLRATTRKPTALENRMQRVRMER